MDLRVVEFWVERGRPDGDTYIVIVVVVLYPSVSVKLFPIISVMVIG